MALASFCPDLVEVSITNSNFIGSPSMIPVEHNNQYFDAINFDFEYFLDQIDEKGLAHIDNQCASYLWQGQKLYEFEKNEWKINPAVKDLYSRRVGWPLEKVMRFTLESSIIFTLKTVVSDNLSVTAFYRVIPNFLTINYKINHLSIRTGKDK